MDNLQLFPNHLKLHHIHKKDDIYLNLFTEVVASWSGELHSFPSLSPFSLC